MKWSTFIHHVEAIPQIEFRRHIGVAELTRTLKNMLRSPEQRELDIFDCLPSFAIPEQMEQGLYTRAEARGILLALKLQLLTQAALDELDYDEVQRCAR